MEPKHTDPDRFSRTFLVALALIISAIFLYMVRDLLSAVLFAAILAGLTHPIYRRFLSWYRGRKTLASATTVVLVLVLIIGPGIALIGIVAAEALDVSERVSPWVQAQLENPDAIDELIANRPWLAELAPYKAEIQAKAGELAGRLGKVFVQGLAATTRGTALFVLQMFVMLYAMFFFLMTGRQTLERILYFVPLQSKDEDAMVDRFLSVTRATLKGTLVIGMLQGFLAAVAFGVVGIEGVFFWGTIMAVLSVIPGIGAALVWVPAVGFLFATGRPTAAVGLGLWCALAVGSVDNVMRPWLVGRDTRMSDLLILLSTLGGIAAFGAQGIVLGPILAALFVTVWEIYGRAFRHVLPVRP